MITVLSTVVNSLSLDVTEAAFVAFEAAFSKTYITPAARARAFECWRENAASADLHAQRNPLATFGANKFSDQCWADFARAHLLRPGSVGPARQPRPMQPALATAVEATLAAVDADGVDWRDRGAVNAVQDQGQCGSCWAFGTVANIEGQSFLWAPAGQNGTLPKLSEQMLVSCDDFKDKTGADQGCNGGWPDRAMQWTINQGGLSSEKTYPYSAGSGQAGQCDSTKETPLALQTNILGFHDLLANESYVAAYVSRFGPVVVGLDATSDWQQYKGGILSAGCDQKKVDHAVVIVGWGTDSGTDYWLIRNSWAAKWGEDGYVRLARNAGNCNAVVSHATSALFGNRSLCLDGCDTGEACCGGDCCPQDSSHTCCTDGCCPNPAACCPADTGGGACCADPKNCCGGQCCDPSYGKCSADGQTCCPLESLCGSECCTDGAKCCADKDDPSKARCSKEQTDTCCADGSSCPLLTACCANPTTNVTQCCKFMTTCGVDGSCSAPTPAPFPTPPPTHPTPPTPPMPTPPTPPTPSPGTPCPMAPCPGELFCCGGKQCCPHGWQCMNNKCAMIP